ncbi:transcription antitermination factor NusB [Niabella ginsengisoli]|uniref:Transcription antitermination factor NusB n=1 Tax=Niabella ginsengisoli TaxID=522298 RepID=A0ABS9SHA7_9BACT|nr:transcription antitermination factor NusB [Niabella ginsengisoli]MCH5597746.1 transcription antitermination factor NusB [Niabella ginsengisoli]
MISRRNIRVKVMQTLYAYNTSLDTDKPLDPQKTLKQHFNQTRSLVTYIIFFLTEVARYAEKDAYKKSHKYVPTEKDLNVNTKLAGSNLLWQILDLNDVKIAFKNEKPEQVTDEELVKKIYIQLTASQQYAHYINIHQQNLQEDRKIFEYIFNDLMLDNEIFISHIEEVFSNWNDDGDMIAQSTAAFIRKPQSLNFHQIISTDKELFAINLLKTVVDKEDYLLSLIKPKLKNWDSERIALLDMVLMKMGVCEFLYFDTIPPKVTINEYIDLAKDYSTAQSGHFVNGILDNIHKELVQDGKLKKKDFRKA